MKVKNYISIVILLLIVTGRSFSQAVSDTIETEIVRPIASNKVQHIGFGIQPEWMVSSAVSSADGSELQKMFVTNLGNTFYGMIPGLTVLQGSGEPGNDSPALYARGVNTFGPGRDLLVMVDGFESSFEHLVPDEIESVTLLKDASATAIYGNRGANGVLLITTKRGFDGPLTVNFRTQHGFHAPTRLPRFLGSYDYARLFNEGLENDGNPARYSQEDLNAYQSGSDPYFFPDVNWYDEVLKNTSYISNYNLNFRGGNNSVRYFVMLNSINSNGLYLNAGDIEEESTNSKYTRFNFRSNVEIDITKRLTATLILGGSVEDKANPVAITTAGLFNSLAVLPPNAFPVYNPDGSFGGNSAFTNPLGDMLQTGSYLSNGRTLQSTLKMTQQLDQITKGLSVTGAVSFNNFFRSYSNKTKQYERFSLSKNTEGNIQYNRFGQNTSLVGSEGDSDQWRNVIFQGFLNYVKSAGNHDFVWMLMANSETYTNISTETDGNANLSFPYTHIGGGGRLTYANSKKYISELSFGYMGSENFPSDNRFGFFPAVSVGWIASEEGFLKNNKTVSFLKIRSSYGLTGNNRISIGGENRYLFDQRYPYTSSYFLSNNNTSVPGIAEGPLANDNVTWEKEKKFNFGFELTLFDRLDFIADVFNQDRYDILVTPNRTVPQYLGAALPLLNEGEVNNKGFEGTIRYSSKPSGAVTYFVEANLWYAQNKITYNAEPLQLFDYQEGTGRPIGQPFGLMAIGLFQNQTDIDNSPRQIFAPVQPGDIKYKDLNGDGVIDQNDAGPIGNPQLPTTTFAFQSGIQYKGFDLYMSFQGITGNTVYFGGNYFHAFQNNGQVAAIALDRWTPETAETASYPRLSASNNLNNYRYSSFWQRDGSFVKLRNLELGYSLPSSITERVKLNNARVFVNGTNLFSIDAMDGHIDPETRNGYPALRTLSMGASFQF